MRLTQGSLVTIAEELSPYEHLVFCFCGLVRQLPKQIDVIDFTKNGFFRGKDDLLEIVQTVREGRHTRIIRGHRSILRIFVVGFCILELAGSTTYHCGEIFQFTTAQIIDIINRINALPALRDYYFLMEVDKIIMEK